jgi:hypothetical protein
MAAIGTLTAPPGTSLSLATFSTPDGWPPEVLEDTVEALRPPGVNGTRLRIPRAQFPEFDASIIIGVASLAEAVAARSSVQGLVGKLVTLTVLLGGVSKTWSNVLVHQSRPQLVPGPVVGAVDAPFHVSAVLRLELTAVADDAAQQNPGSGYEIVEVP